jgi:hypothetical protein
MDFRPAPSHGGAIGLGLLAAAVIVEGLLLWQLWGAILGGLGPDAALLGLLATAGVPLCAWLAYWVWGYFSLRYSVTRDGVIIRWAAHRHVLPMREISHLFAGRPYGGRLRGLHWPGHEIGRTSFQAEDGQSHPLLVYATVPAPGQLVLLAGGLTYAISPADRTGFINEFKIRERLGPLQPLAHGTLQPRWAGLTIWRDGLSLALLAAATLANVLIWCGLAWLYPGLPRQVALLAQYDPALGQTVAGPMQPLPAAWLLPVIGLAALLADAVLATAVHARAELGARLLLSGALLVQLALGVVLIRII